MKKRKLTVQKKKDMIFYAAMMLFPMVQFCVFYICVNGNSILMAFQNIDIANNTVTWTFDNIKNALSMMTTSPLLIYTKTILGRMRSRSCCFCHRLSRQL